MSVGINISNGTQVEGKSLQQEKKEQKSCFKGPCLYL